MRRWRWSQPRQRELHSRQEQQQNHHHQQQQQGQEQREQQQQQQQLRRRLSGAVAPVPHRSSDVRHRGCGEPASAHAALAQALALALPLEQALLQ